MEQGSETLKSRGTKRLAILVSLTAAAVGAAAVYSYWRVERVRVGVEIANEFHVPVLKHLSLLSGKWAAYQRSFEQAVNFKSWGEPTNPQQRTQRLPLRKLTEPNLAEIVKRLERPEFAKLGLLNEEREGLRQWMKELSEISDSEAANLAEISSLAHAKHFAEAAALYSTTKQRYSRITQELRVLTLGFENRLAEMQVSTESELRESQQFTLLLLTLSLVAALLVLLTLRRWFHPILEWTKTAQRIALHGLERGMDFPKISSKMPPEMQILTSEFTRMAMTVLERERTIQGQRDKLTEQNDWLKKLGALNERVLNSMTSGLLVVGADGRVEQFNERYCEIFKITRSYLLGSSAKEALALWPADYIAKWLHAKESLHEPRLHVSLDQTVERIFDVRITLLNSSGGRLFVFDDITGLVEAEVKLAHAQKLALAGNLSAQVAHEVRNPLNSMSLQLEMLEEDFECLPVSANRKETAARIQAVREQISRLDRITRRYLDVGQRSMNSGVAHTSIDLCALVENAVSFLNAEIQSAQIQCTLDLPQTTIPVVADGDGMAEVVFNLVRNAIEALKSHTGPKQIRVSGRANDGLASIKIEDTGPGLSEKVQAQLFEPFVTDRANGHGLGLSVSRQICIAHGGDLRWLGGSAFEFSVPVQEKKVRKQTKKDMDVDVTHTHC